MDITNAIHLAFIFSIELMLASVFIPAFHATCDYVQQKRRINQKAAEQVKNLDAALSSLLSDTHQSMQKALMGIKHGVVKPGSVQGTLKIIKFEQDVFRSVVAFALVEETHRPNPEKTEWNRGTIELFLSTLLDVYTGTLKMSRNEAIDKIQEGIFFAFAKLDVKGELPLNASLVNLADSFFEKKPAAGETAGKIK